MASEKITAIIEELKGLTVLELSELVHAVEDEFGVSAAAAVAVAGPADGGAAAAAAGRGQGRGTETGLRPVRGVRPGGDAEKVPRPALRRYAPAGGSAADLPLFPGCGTAGRTLFRTGFPSS